MDFEQYCTYKPSCEKKEVKEHCPKLCGTCNDSNYHFLTNNNPNHYPSEIIIILITYINTIHCASEFVNVAVTDESKHRSRVDVHSNRIIQQDSGTGTVGTWNVQQESVTTGLYKASSKTNNIQSSTTKTTAMSGMLNLS